MQQPLPALEICDQRLYQLKEILIFKNAGLAKITT